MCLIKGWVQRVHRSQVYGFKIALSHIRLVFEKLSNRLSEDGLFHFKWLNTIFRFLIVLAGHSKKDGISQLPIDETCVAPLATRTIHDRIMHIEYV